MSDNSEKKNIETFMNTNQTIAITVSSLIIFGVILTYIIMPLIYNRK